MSIVQSIDVDSSDGDVIDTSQYDQDKQNLLRHAINDYITERMNALSH